MKQSPILMASLLTIAAAGMQSNAIAFADSTNKASAKELFLPSKVWKVPDSNDYKNPESEFAFQRMVEGENAVVFWSKTFGTDPMANPDSTKRFKAADMMKECERFYNFYVDTLKFVDKGSSVTDKYKTLFYIINDKGATAFGGGADNKIGILWAPPVRVNKAPYGALAHELGHSFQYLVHANGSWGFTSSPKGSRGQSIFEMTSQFMLWQVYPEWMIFENYHLVSFMQKTHYAFLHETNQYHSPYVLEYWASKHGVDFIGKLWRQAEKGEDAVMAYKRLTNTSQTAFNDEIFDAARRFITWDMPRVEQVSKRYANQHTSELNPMGKDWYRIAASRCPQNYGYNGIQLKVPEGKSKISLQFKGVVGVDSFRAINKEKAGWRYGFVAVKKDGTRVYGEAQSATKGKSSFEVPAETAYLWLVVSGAPTEHWEHISDGKDENDEQWPYEIKLTGTSPVDAIVKEKAVAAK